MWRSSRLKLQLNYLNYWALVVSTPVSEEASIEYLTPWSYHLNLLKYFYMCKIKP